MRTTTPFRAALVFLAAGCLSSTAGCDGNLVKRSFTAQEIQAARATVVAEPHASDSPIARLAQRPIIREATLSETAADSLARIGEQALPVLIAALTDPQPAVRSNAAQALARLGPAAKDAVPALVTCLSDEDRQVRLNAARALGQIGPDAAPAIPPLSAAMRDVETAAPSLPRTAAP